MSGPIVRQARPYDLSRLGAIEASGAQTFAAAGDPLADGSPPASPDAWRAAMEAGCVWVLDDPPEGLIGFLAGELAEHGLYIAEIDVVMDHQRKGHGRRLMQWVIGWAKAKGLAALTLTTFRDVAWNAPFYASLGFVEIPACELSPRLIGILENQAARGFDPRRRCAMRLTLED
ncbi:MAG TPA: GNAT family N-acetyltransferase [Caulobacteraceae bacterium]